MFVHVLLEENVCLSVFLSVCVCVCVTELERVSVCVCVHYTRVLCLDKAPGKQQSLFGYIDYPEVCLYGSQATLGRGASMDQPFNIALSLRTSHDLSV